MILPVTRDAATAEFLDGTALGEFRLRRSRVTGEWLPPQAQVDSTGSADLEWVAAAGAGRLVSWAVSYGKPVDGVQPVQSVVAIVELDEGPWWWTELLGAEVSSLREGLPVAVEFVKPDGSAETLPVFRVRDRRKWKEAALGGPHPRVVLHIRTRTGGSPPSSWITSGSLP